MQFKFVNKFSPHIVEWSITEKVSVVHLKDPRIKNGHCWTVRFSESDNQALSVGDFHDFLHLPKEEIIKWLNDNIVHLNELPTHENFPLEFNNEEAAERCRDMYNARIQYLIQTRRDLFDSLNEEDEEE
jgi:hypothetical protein